MTAQAIGSRFERIATAPRAARAAPLVAASLALLVLVTGARGVDLAAATYRVEMFGQNGLTVWDSQWYGGHWTFSYSVLFAPIGWLAGIPLMDIACSALAAWAFDRLAVPRFGRAGRLGAAVFAVGTVVQVAIGQEPYLLGETFGLVALVAANEGRLPLALALALACPFASPLAGAFLAIASAAWLVGRWPARRGVAASVAGAAAVPLILLQVLFPGQGTMPFATLEFVGMLGALLPLGIVAARVDRAIASGVLLYAATVAFAFFVPSALGDNITRLGACFGVALAATLASSRVPGRRLLAIAAVPFALAQWLPAEQALSGAADPSTSATYFHPLLTYLRQADQPLGRVEVVPTALHWEAAFVAPYLPLARGWERQLDVANNALFYGSHPLTPAAYRAWLLANGVRFVALADVSLDYSAFAEAGLVRAQAAGLSLVWRNADWRVYAVQGAPGLVSGPAVLLSAGGADVALQATGTAPITVRERYVGTWRVTRGDATIAEASGGWLLVSPQRPGPIDLHVGL
ncbi:MAG TPA: hypothetical protein VG165_04385 [Solirubrobacteraceae bacterium]|nr:hypothetical protein [Solirubrobacteraceae bacterium]